MPCRATQSWTFRGLVAAFLDLAVAYLLLCAASLVYLSSKFLSLFGSSLPCPCDGLFSNLDKNKCFQETLANSPVKKISAVRGTVKNRIPFDSILFKDLKCAYSGEDKKGERGTVELEGETSSILVPGLGSVAAEKEGSWNENVSGLGLLSSQSLEKGSYEIKGKQFRVHKPRYGLRHRRRCKFGYENSPKSPTYVTKSVNDVEEKESGSGNSEEGGKALEDGLLCKRVSLMSYRDEPAIQERQERASSSVREDTCGLPVDLAVDGDAQSMIKILQHALKEERAARTALSLELEKERNAAATAADEAMAVILRLQAEKASIEMEARQHQQMIEEKSAFDAEEMTILKEILLRREREKLFLEEEVESYRQMLLEIEQPRSILQDAKAAQSEGTSLSCSNEDTDQISYSTPESFAEKRNMGTVEFCSGPNIVSNQVENCVLEFGNESVFYDYGDFLKPGEDRRVPVDNKKETKLHKLEETSEFSQSINQGLNIDEKFITLTDGDLKERVEVNPLPESMPRLSESHYPKTIIPDSNDQTEKVRGDSSDADSHVHDIHVIAYEDRMSDKVPVNVPMDHSKASVCVSCQETKDLKLDRSKSVSDTSCRLPPICPPQQQKMLSPDMRRKSMSALDYERSKIMSEVGRLWGRLRVVQQGREKLSLSMSKAQLQLPEDIAAQLREIKQLSEPGRSVPQGSFRRPSSMVNLMSKKRRWRPRSATLDLHSA